MRRGKDGGHGPALVTASALVLMLAVPAGTTLAQQAGAADQPPARIGPEWDWRKHQPNPAEIEARERADGRQLPADPAESREVDQLYRELTGQDPAAVPRTPPREVDRR